MGTLAWILGILGGLCAVMGIVTAVEIIPLLVLGAAFTVMFWLALAAVLLLACVAATIASSGYE